MRAVSESVAVFESGDTLVLPERYRDWIPVASSSVAGQTVYINPRGYREYARTGRFPQGTMVIWESARGSVAASQRPHQESAVLLASVKDSSRFDGGWGFFDFTGAEGTVASRAALLPESSGCRACHRQGAETAFLGRIL
jgi:hypothetical protein